MATHSRGSALLSRLRALLVVQRFSHSLAERGAEARFRREIGSGLVLDGGRIDLAKWRKVDSRAFGITSSMISSPSWIVLKTLRVAGFEAYLVGGCVRDLLLNKVPKDFDVVTTASLKEVRKKFHHCLIVGRRFPICMVNIKGSVVEVSSFQTVPQNCKEKEKLFCSLLPYSCDKKDAFLWRNCLHRDFTINSLFFDPFMDRIYDYAGGIMDVKSLKLRTLIPARQSFQEDCARILRGLRIAARLGLSFSKDTETAIRELSLSILSLAKSRIMMELNYMLSYGAAEPSLCLLQRFKLLEILLPFQAAYLDQKACEKSNAMLMKLLFNLDKLVTCDRPAESSLWVGLLAFHMALVNTPQDALVIWTFASVLYHGTWKNGVKFAREQAQATTSFVPEISEAHEFISDGELAESVSQLASAVQYSINALTDMDSLLQSMSRFPDLTCSGLVFVPNRMGNLAAHIFDVLVHNVESYDDERSCFYTDHILLGKGNVGEVRFVLGKIIMDTMRNGVVQGKYALDLREGHLHALDPEHKAEVSGENCTKMHQMFDEEHRNRSLSKSIAELWRKGAKKKKYPEKCDLSKGEKTKKQQSVYSSDIDSTGKRKLEMNENDGCPDGGQVVKRHQSGARLQHPKVREEKQPPIVNEKYQEERLLENKKLHFLWEKPITGNKEKHKQDVLGKKRNNHVVLSSLFR